MGIDNKWAISIGQMEPGPRNQITDVPGVLVGHCTIARGSAQTGVTAIRPHTGNLFREKVPAACHVINGFGKSVGLVQIEELGSLETPILLTNTLNVGTASQALVTAMLEENPDIGDTTGTVNPVVCECNDGGINEIRSLHVHEEHIRQALAACQPDFEEGSVGAGRGMRCHGLKGGIGSASRLFSLDGQSYTLGALALTNHGRYEDLLVNGRPVGAQLPYPVPAHEDKGSVIVILATDAPASDRQLKRLCKRVPAGLARVGSYIGNGSGDIAIAFSTANRIPHYPDTDIRSIQVLHDNKIDRLFRAVIECTEEAVLSSMLHASAVPGRDGTTLPTLTEVLSSY